MKNLDGYASINNTHETNKFYTESDENELMKTGGLVVIVVK